MKSFKCTCMSTLQVNVSVCYLFKLILNQQLICSKTFLFFCTCSLKLLTYIYCPRYSGTGLAQSVEALYFTTELHTSSVQVRVQPGTQYLYGKTIPLECMWFRCRLPVAVVSQAYPGNAEICHGFPPPQAALCIIPSNEGDAVYTKIDR